MMTESLDVGSWFPWRVVFALALLWAAGATLASAQDQNPQASPAPPIAEQQPTFKTTRNLATVDAVVVDRDGHQVTDLTAADFEIKVGGRMQPPQQAVYVPLRSALAQAVSAPSSPAAPARASPSPIPLIPSRSPAAATTTRTIAVVVDDLGLSFESITNVRNALRTFVDEAVRPGDLVAILRTSGGIGALQQFTTDKRLLHAAVDRVQWTVLSRSGVSAFAPVEPAKVGDAPYTDPARSDPGERKRTDRELGSSRYEDDLDAVRESVLATGSLGALEFVVRGVQQLPGRKAVVFISEGFELFDQKGRAKVWNSFSRLMDRANRAGVVIYTVDGRGLESGGLTAEDNPQLSRAGPTEQFSEKDFRALLLGARATRLTILENTEEAMHFLAWQTGGFAITNSNDFTRAFRRILDDLQGYYLLGYDMPDDASKGWDPGAYVVRVKRAGLSVRSRHGLFGPSGPRDQQEQSGDPLLMAALSPFNSGAVSLRLTSLFAHDARQGDYVRSLLFIDANGLTFTKADDGRHVAALEIVHLAVGDNGQLPGNWRTLTLRLTDEQLANARARGVVYSTRMTVEAPGAYQVRSAVRDTTSGAVGSASQFLEVPPVGSGSLALSGVLMKSQIATDATTTEGNDDAAIAGEEAVAEVLGEPAIRIFKPGSRASYAYEIYDGLEDSAGLAVSTTLVRNGKTVYESPETTVPPAGAKKAPVRIVPIAGSLDLGQDMPPGPYSLQVVVARHHGGKIDRRASQWVDFDVR